VNFAELWHELEPISRDPGTGGYDGALGVVTALAAVDLLRDKIIYPERSIALAVFTEEEGARFRVPCLGSRLLTGAVDPADCEAGVRALALVLEDLACR
jgi:hypothetical protein